MSIYAGNKLVSGGGSATQVDDLTITKNADQEIQSVGVLNQRTQSTAVKTWVGTKAQYEAIETKDPVTVYHITDEGGSEGTTDYNELSNQPQINSVTLAGNKTSEDLGLVSNKALFNIKRINNTLTLFAGSKFPIPDGFDSNGIPKFKFLTINEDYVYSFGSRTGKYILTFGQSAWNAENSIDFFSTGLGNYWISDTAPTNTSGNNHLWYDTANNLIKTSTDKGSTWVVSDVSLPFSQVDTVSGVIAIRSIFTDYGQAGNLKWVIAGDRVSLITDSN